ncbi:unnamed protein product [Lactuca virosa]|uniref:Cytochrome P450 n=1 Tax=Lactuca virosa TaxID=75947 RepID=A0AAU9PM39_9ASTR|nr:unnamed protein product [Lactuca virosa]
MLTNEGLCEVDVWPHIQTLTSDVISRTAFGSNFKEGRKIFELQREQAKLVMKAARSFYIPGLKYFPTKRNNSMKEIDREVKTTIKRIIDKRVIAMKAGESSQETTANMLVWTMILLGQHTDWQTRARDEVLHLFGKRKPDVDGLNHLKIINMIFCEVLRLYPPATIIRRLIYKETKLGNITLPAHTLVEINPLFLHHDNDIWGDDANDFKPERFSEGVSKVNKGQASYLPFGGGPRICIGQNFAMLEAKMALVMVLQCFSFELSPSYSHAPYTIITLQPQFGAHLILHKI